MADWESSDKVHAPRRLVGSLPLILIAVLVLGLFVGCTVVFPRYLAASDLDYAKVTPTELAEARNNVRMTLLQGLGGFVLLIGAYLTWRQTQISRAASRDELRLSREGQLTDRTTEHQIEIWCSCLGACFARSTMRSTFCLVLPALTLTMGPV
jgi:hypothetical protein